ncbi:hypothetical protein DICPUDRAFT_26967 [Dictyostelium purpureum]|uniref:Uncharacterized protein n=1 Tax=Dictyostelium purpureum TaxID=5786 RepID=F0Z9G6_DICPU|nr:uncharacterized protein DICPUDRAFT_26967 [Dictyostelium purpureum]EGC39409.1 hypothetical protein DICPUDRAFT_26967 [Dictyostelium purpureum]|eukprot:XP_003284083.1 hypothetical protein DICPUDRAFT_26967 [Dictyostelium purpureum]
MIKYSLLLVLLFVAECVFSFSCCVPKQWSGSSNSYDSEGNQIQKNYFYDSTKLLVRIDTIYLNGSFNQTTYSSYANLTTTGSEWVMNNLDNTCYQTGPDYWNGQCFGDIYGLPFQYSSPGKNVFSNPTNGITVVTDSYCRPTQITNKLANIQYNFFNLKSGVYQSAFVMPSVCK